MNEKLALLWIAVFFLGCSGVSQEKQSYFFAFGDMPYADNQLERYERMVKHINDSDPLFSIHVGDTKSGSSDCSDEFYEANRKHLNSIAQILQTLF